MTHASLRSLRATTALSAVLAFGSVPALAQDIAPPPDAVAAPASPSAAPQPAAPQQPTLQLPTDAPAPAAPPASPSMTSQPVIEQTPQTAAAPAAETRPVRSAAERSPAARTGAAPQPRVASPRTAKPTVASRPTVAPMPPVASVPLAQPAVAPAPAPAARALPSAGGMGPGVWIAGLIVILGAGAAAFFATRSRRREDEFSDETYETASVQTYVEPAPLPEPMTAGEPTGGLVPEAPLPAFTTIEDRDDADMPGATEQARETIGTEELVPATAPPADEAPRAFAMPAGPVPRGEARDALLRQMVDAPPDAENPFRSRKARLRRARLILQHLEHQQDQAATQPFDWRTYQPSTSHPAPATPPRVTA